ncbi:response regulator transcription factor [Actinomadura sp. KC216]|uniref:response regulator transcription factor n=1 Tax=Actinomadura sp. KC216 TaxID=2530370 RepID=UPI001FB5FAAB|nr:response regulator transcription factor [Actinomadura sp. KC216]
MATPTGDPGSHPDRREASPSAASECRALPGTCLLNTGALSRLDAVIAQVEQALRQQHDLVEALRRSRADLVGSCGRAGSSIGSAPCPDESAIFVRLTDRERRVLILIAEGLTNRGIARRLRISEKTVRNHVHAIFCKLGVRSRTEAALVGVRGGLLRP